MKPFVRKEDGTSMIAVPQGRLVELFIPVPGTDRVLTSYVTQSVLVRFAVWALCWWVFSRWFGLRALLEMSDIKAKIKDESSKELEFL